MPSGYPGTAQTKKCEQCPVLFKYKPAVARKGHARFCSTDCANAWQSLSKTGQPKLWTAEWKEKLRQSNFLKRGKPSGRLGTKAPWAAGANNVNWKGGVTSENEKQRTLFRKSVHKRILERDNYACVFCEATNTYLHVDHIKKWADYPELRFDVDNCRTLCMACHYYVTFKRKLPQGVSWGITPRQRIQ